MTIIIFINHLKLHTPLLSQKKFIYNLIWNNCKKKILNLIHIGFLSYRYYHVSHILRFDFTATLNQNITRKFIVSMQNWIGCINSGYLIQIFQNLSDFTPYDNQFNTNNKNMSRLSCIQNIPRKNSCDDVLMFQTIFFTSIWIE